MEYNIFDLGWCFCVLVKLKDFVSWCLRGSHLEIFLNNVKIIYSGRADSRALFKRVRKVRTLRVRKAPFGRHRKVTESATENIPPSNL